MRNAPFFSSPPLSLGNERQENVFAGRLRSPGGKKVETNLQQLLLVKGEKYRTLSWDYLSKCFILKRLLKQSVGICEVNWKFEVKRANVNPVIKKGKKEDPGNCRPVSFTSVHGKVGQQLILETVSRHMKERKVSGSSQNGFMKEKSCLTKLITLYNEVTSLMNRAMDGVYLDFSKAFDIVFHDILIEKLAKYV
ncbi:LOW QUALITY PROTEIN: hypothetical protein QYF61_016276 [Mycteria americana]|uniref:Reverse transcriptase domain-containing protein n=1 Tax=Mycteria americana TaxID=33587 RepID=A0AAN7MYR3_MYCAM|nr:LOW QUALITY PROTEIN: hypothetical protein QYF61_016276 [Mycteria americana]